MDKFLNSSRKRDNPEVISNIEKKQKIRKYDDSYLNFGFTSTVVANVEHPQCVVCLKVMVVESMLPNKMKRHLETVHGNLVNKPRDYLVSKLKAMAQQKHIFTKQATIPSKALLSSYKVAFTTDLPSELTITEQEQLIDLYSDSVSKSKFVSLSLPEFWIAMKKQYPIVANKAIRTLIPFASSYLCETGFSALAVIKSKYRGKLNTEKEMRIALSKFTPRFDDLMQQKQAQPSH